MVDNDIRLYRDGKVDRICGPKAGIKVLITLCSELIHLTTGCIYIYSLLTGVHLESGTLTAAYVFGRKITLDHLVRLETVT